MYFCAVMGMIPGCEKKEEAPTLPATEEIAETKNDLEEREESPEVMNVMGMPLRDDTALLVTVTKYRFSDDYKDIVGQYEYDSEGRMLRYFRKGLPSSYHTEYEYDVDGNLIKETRYYDEGQKNTWKLNYWIEYNYEKDETIGQFIQLERQYDADGGLSRESVYDSEDNLLRERSYVENVLRSEYEYNSLEHQLWKSFYDEQGNITFQCKEVYDEAGNIILKVEYDAEGNINVFEGYECDTYVISYPYWRYENIYDNHENLIKRTVYDYENNEIELMECTYDEKGNLISEFFQDEMVTEGSEYEYDAESNCIKYQIMDYKYDDDGNLTVDGTIVRWEWKYDEENRLIKSIDYRTGSECWYEYDYSTIDISNEDYPYDKINMQQYWF